MNFQSLCKRLAASAFAALFVFGASALAQGTAKPTVIGPTDRSFRVAEGSNVQCAGYVQSGSIDTSNRLVGAVNEQDGWFYSQFNYVYLNMGSGSGVKPGDVMSVVRPRGQVKTRWTKKGDLGMYVQEVGTVEVVRVKSDVSVARVKMSCDNFLLGDLVRPVETRMVPMFEKRPALDLFGDPSGKAMGRLFMARDSQEVLAREQIVYVDLGAEDNVKIGDYLTVFRPLGKGNPFENDEDESVAARQEGYQSSEYRGGRFSNQSGRKSGDNARGKVVTTEEAKKGRPALRQVVGELVVLNVKEKVATAVIVRTAQEIHTGDWVEVQ